MIILGVFLFALIHFVQSQCDCDGAGTTCSDLSWAIWKNGLYWAWASPCSGGCSQLPDPLPYDWRRATSTEWDNGNGHPAREEFTGLGAESVWCAASYFDPTYDHCDETGTLVYLDNGSYDETLIVHDPCDCASDCDGNGNSCESLAWAVEKNGLYWAWASPCSGGCSTLPDPLPYDWRRATSTEWDNGNGHPAREEFTGIGEETVWCAAPYFDPTHDHCDETNTLVYLDNDGADETLIVHDKTCEPTAEPTENPSPKPTEHPTPKPSTSPTPFPTDNTNSPTTSPTVSPTITPTKTPSIDLNADGDNGDDDSAPDEDDDDTGDALESTEESSIDENGNPNNADDDGNEDGEVDDENDDEENTGEDSFVSAMGLSDTMGYGLMSVLALVLICICVGFFLCARRKKRNQGMPIASHDSNKQTQLGTIGAVSPTTEGGGETTSSRTTKSPRKKNKWDFDLTTPRNPSVGSNRSGQSGYSAQVRFQNAVTRGAFPNSSSRLADQPRINPNAYGHTRGAHMAAVASASDIDDGDFAMEVAGSEALKTPRGGGDDGLPQLPPLANSSNWDDGEYNDGADHSNSELYGPRTDALAGEGVILPHQPEVNLTPDGDPYETPQGPPRPPPPPARSVRSDTPM